MGAENIRRSISLQITQGDDAIERLSIEGPIDEDAEMHLMGIADQLGEKPTINLRGITSVNSCGVRAWINFMRRIEAGREITFEECTPEIVGQINMIPSFKANAAIKSVYAGYACESCGHSDLKLFEQGKNLPDSPDDELEEFPCPKCDTVMEMEELEEEFFSWLDHQ